MSQKTERLENGLLKLQSTASQVDDLKAKLASQEVELKQKNEDADKLIEKVGVETEKVSKEKAIADEEEKKVQVIAKDVSEKQRSCEEDLAKAEPALKAAQEALNTLNKNNLTELKSFGSPPSAVVNVTCAVMVLLAPPSKIPKDRSWKQAKIMMAKVNMELVLHISYSMVLHIIRGAKKKYEQRAKCPLVLYVKPSNKRFIIPLQNNFVILASLFW